MNLRSSVNDIGGIVTQIIHFKGDIKRTIPGIIVSTIKEGEFTKFKLKDGRMLMINKKNVLMIEVFNEN